MIDQSAFAKRATAIFNDPSIEEMTMNDRNLYRAMLLAFALVTAVHAVSSITA